MPDPVLPAGPLTPPTPLQPWNPAQPFGANPGQFHFPAPKPATPPVTPPPALGPAAPRPVTPPAPGVQHPPGVNPANTPLGQAPPPGPSATPALDAHARQMGLARPEPNPAGRNDFTKGVDAIAGEVGPRLAAARDSVVRAATTPFAAIPWGKMLDPSIGRHYSGPDGKSVAPYAGIQAADQPVTPLDVGLLAAPAGIGLARGGLSLGRGATMAARPAVGTGGRVAAGLAGEEAAAGAAPGLGRRAADFLTRNDYATGVVGPVRNTVDAARHALAGNTNAAIGSGVRAVGTASAPGIGYTIDEALNRPGSTYADRQAMRVADPTSLTREPPNPFTKNFWENLGPRLQAYGRMTYSPNELAQFVGGNVAQLGRVGGALVRNPEGVAATAGRTVGDAIGGFTPDSQGDQWRALNAEYHRLGQEYHAAAADPKIGPEAARQAFQQKAHALSNRFASLDYSPGLPDGTAHARDQVLRPEIMRRMGIAPGSAEESALQDHFARGDARRLFHPPGPEFDPERQVAPFPTARQLDEARRYYGQGDPLRPSDGNPQNGPALGRAFVGGLTGQVPQSPEQAATRRQVLERDAEARATQLRPFFQQPTQPPTAMGAAAPQTAPAPRPVEPPAQTSQAPAAPSPNPFRDGTGQASSPAGPPPEVVAAAPPEVKQDLANADPGRVQAALRQFGGLAMAGGAALTPTALAAAVQNVQTAPPPAGFGEFWGSMSGASKFLAVAGLSLAAISFLKNSFGGDDDEPGFLMKVLPLLGLGAAAWGLGGGTMTSLPSVDRYKQLGDAAMNSFSGLRLGAAPR